MNIYDFEDYRSFLNAWLDEKKIRTVRGLAMRLDVSPSLVTKIRKGQRSIGVEQAQHWAWALRLGTYEADYFDGLVRAEEAPTERIRDEARREVAAARSWESARRGDMLIQLYSEWYIPVVCELAATSEFREDPVWIGEQLRPQITSEQAAHALDVLFAVGMLERIGDDLTPRPMTSTTGRRLEKGDKSRGVGRTHTAFLEHTLDCLHSLPPEERCASIVTVALPTGKLDQIEKLLQKLQVEAAAVLDSDQLDRVFQLGVYLTPRSAKPE